jgi:molybdopterin-guanine dinucleotide biosynthesis protein A
VSCTGVILAGGGATRFGGAPKGLELVRGERIIDRVAAALRPVTDELLLVANAPAAEEWLPGVRRVRDIRTGAGALGGLHAALTHAEGNAVLLVAWDMPFVPSALLAAMRARGEDASAGAVDAVLPESEASRRGVEPLCAWYGPACLPAVEAALARDDLRVIGFHDAIRLERLTLDVVRAFGDPAVMFSNVNTRADLAQASGAERTRD